MPPNLPTKEQLRREMRQRLARLDPEEIARESHALCQHLTFPAGCRVALFAATSREPMLLELIPRSPEVSWFLPKVTGPGTMAFLPISHLGNLRHGAFDIPEPPDGPEAGDLDVILCPGLAFTRDGGRLGQGGGYYDRALPRYPGARKIGVALSCQVVETLPRESHDLAMDALLTPEQGFSDGNAEC